MYPIHPEDAIFDNPHTEAEEAYSFKELLVSMFKGLKEKFIVNQIEKMEEEPKEEVRTPGVSSSVDKMKISEEITSVYLEENIGNAYSSQNSKDFSLNSISRDFQCFNDDESGRVIHDNAEIIPVGLRSEDLSTPMEEDATLFEENKFKFPQYNNLKWDSNLMNFSLGPLSTKLIRRPIALCSLREKILSNNKDKYIDTNDFLMKEEEIMQNSEGNLQTSSWSPANRGVFSTQKFNNYNNGDCIKDNSMSSCKTCIDWSFLEKLYNHSPKKTLVNTVSEMFAKHSDFHSSEWKKCHGVDTKDKFYTPKEKKSAKMSKNHQSSLVNGVQHKGCAEFKRNSSQRVLWKGSSRRISSQNTFTKGIPLSVKAKTGRKSLTRKPSA